MFGDIVLAVTAIVSMATFGVLACAYVRRLSRRD